MKGKAEHEAKHLQGPDPCDRTGELQEILDGIVARFEILKEELRAYVASEVAELKRGVRRFAVNAVLGVSGAFGAVAVVVTSIVFCLSGLAGLLSDATSRPWLGSLLAGAIGLGLCVGGLLIARAKLRGPKPKEGEST
jgi:hypothetical protein